MTTSPDRTTLNVIIEEARHRRSEHPRVTQLPEPLSPSYRSQSPNRNTATGADMSTMNRDSTSLVQWQVSGKRWPERKETLSRGPLTWSFLAARTGFEPVPPP